MGCYSCVSQNSFSNKLGDNVTGISQKRKLFDIAVAGRSVLKTGSKAGLVAVLTASIVLPGCVTTREDRIGRNDGSDACYQYRAALDSTGDYYGEDMLKGAAVGAVAGAALGLLATGNARGALAGAAVGLTAGGLGGYWNAKAKQGRDQAILGILNDLDQENQNLGKTQVALDQLVNCRRAEIAQIKGDYKAKRISKDMAEARLATVRQLLDKDYEIANKINGNVIKRRDEFLFAADQISPGSSDRIRTAQATKQTTAKKPAKPAKPSTVLASADSNTQVLARTTSAFETSEKINASTMQLQQASKEATLEAA